MERKGRGKGEEGRGRERKRNGKDERDWARWGAMKGGREGKGEGRWNRVCIEREGGRGAYRRGRRRREEGVRAEDILKHLGDRRGLLSK
jgi:hypothetical protein